LPENGNFVLTEFQLQAAPATDPGQLSPVRLTDPQADFTQQGFDIGQSIDGEARNQGGWAVSPAGGVVHWATYQTQQPVGFEGGTVLRFVLDQYHNAQDHRLGRFRISVTASDRPVGLTLPESLRAVLATDAEHRDQAQQNVLTGYFRTIDSELRTRQAELAAANKPLPVDPGIEQRQAHLDDVSGPIAEDARLVQLRSDHAHSARQLANRRLTLAQDLAWALINSPAFLFNH
jgi:hypothetical protein